MARKQRQRSAASPSPSSGNPDEVVTYRLEDLGYEIPRKGSWLADQLQVEFVCFRIAHPPQYGGLGRFGHLKRIIDLLWNNPDLRSPKRFIWNPWSERILRKLCDERELVIAGCTSAGKSGPVAVFATACYIADPTHTLGLVMSTTIAGAKKRIWGTIREYWEAIPGFPGKPLWSTNEIQGPTYDGASFGQASGLYLLASEQSNEKSALDKLIGIKAPRTGEPNESFESLVRREEFASLIPRFSEAELRELLPRLLNLSGDRIGTMFLFLDEATGCAPSILNVIQSNLMPGNPGHFQVAYIGNPNSHFDPLGLAATPRLGWDSVTLEDEEWETVTGGVCIRFNAERNPRITENNDTYSWMLRKEDIRQMEATYGRESLYYYRMVLGFWSPTGTEVGAYSEADFIRSGSMGPAVWGVVPPVRHSGLDPSFVVGGDRSSCTFGLRGRDVTGLDVLLYEEEVTLKADIASDVPVSYQIVRAWRDECLKRGVPPERACFDGTGGGVTFGDVVRTQWSARVHSISSGGKPSRLPVGTEKDPQGNRVLCCDRYANAATEIWYGAHPFLRSGQLRGVPSELAKEVCTRQHDKTGRGDGRTLRIENKRVYKSRQGHSPDSSDSFMLLVHHLKTRHGFRCSERAAPEETPTAGRRASVSTWAAFCERARAITRRRHLKT